MDQDDTQQANFAALAFGELRAEVSLLRRAVERLTDERTSQPDYAPSLEVMGKRLEDVCVWAQHVSEKPALKLTPQSSPARLRRRQRTVARTIDNCWIEPPLTWRRPAAVSTR